MLLHQRTSFLPQQLPSHRRPSSLSARQMQNPLLLRFPREHQGEQLTDAQLSLDLLNWFSYFPFSVLKKKKFRLLKAILRLCPSWHSRNLGPLQEILYINWNAKNKMLEKLSIYIHFKHTRTSFITGSLYWNKPKGGLTWYSKCQYTVNVGIGFVHFAFDYYVV